MKNESTEQAQKQALRKTDVMHSYKGLPKPKLEDFYDTQDPRGCSSSEYNEYTDAVKKWERDNNYA